MKQSIQTNMPKYIVTLSKPAKKQLDKLSDHLTLPIFEAIANLEENPRPDGYRKLSGRNGYRIRVGNYRVIYEIIDSELIILVIAVGHRKDIYKV